MTEQELYSLAADVRRVLDEANEALRQTRLLWALLSPGEEGGGSGIIDIRFNPANSWIEVIYAEQPGVWVQKIQFKKPCPTVPVGQPT